MKKTFIDLAREAQTGTSALSDQVSQTSRGNQRVMVIALAFVAAVVAAYFASDSAP